MEKFLRLTSDMKHMVERAIPFRHSALQALLLVAALLVPQLVLAQTATKPAHGDGTQESPYSITTAEELAWFRDEVNNNDNTACAALIEDIDMSSVCHAAGDGKEELSWEPISTGNVEWKGTFNGGYKTISNLYINNGGDNIGLFGKIATGIIKNTNLKDANVRGGNYAGIVVGYAAGATIQKVYIDINSVIECSGYDIGGIAGFYIGQIENCTNTATVKGFRDVGGICGYNRAYESFTAKIRRCANYGQVTGSAYEVGGISGKSDNAVIEDCANYGAVQGTYYIGGITGLIYGEKAEVKNVFSNGGVTASQDKAGLVIGAQYEIQRINIGGGQIFEQKTPEASVTGLLVYDVEATLESNGSAAEARAIGEGSGNADMTKGLTRDQLSKGYGTYLLSRHASEGVTWNQFFLPDSYTYPVLGGFLHSIYPYGVVEISCKGDVVSGSFTNDPNENPQFKLVHVNYTHHEKVAETCVADGIIDYYECNDCHKIYKDEAMAEGEELSEEQLVISATGHSYGENDVCTKCQKAMPALNWGNNAILIDRAFGNAPYTMFKLVVEKQGTVEITGDFDASYYPDYQVALFDSDKQEVSSATSSNSRISLTYNVGAGKYYLGLKEKNGNAIELEQTLTLKFGELTVTLPDGMSGKGTPEEPFELYTAEHLKWFADHVNGNDVTMPHLSACATLMDNIDMSSVCHAATDETDSQNGELTWKPISPATDSYDIDFGTIGWHGVFDGNGKTLSNLYINYENEWYGNNVGLFGYVSQGATIKDLTLSKAVAKNTDYARGNSLLAGRAHGATIQNVNIDGVSTLKGGNGAGSIVGIIMDTQVIDCENHAAVNGGSYSVMGGICGYAVPMTNSDSSDLENSDSDAVASRNLLKHCANYGAVSGYYSNGSGGVIGILEAGTLEGCANYANIQGWVLTGGIAGSIAGGTVKNVFTNGNVTIDSNGSGGLVAGACEKATAEGWVAYNKDAKLTVDGTETEARAFDTGGSLAEGANLLAAFTAEEIMSGKVAYMLNQNETDGTQTWYQKLGEGGDAYPVMTPAEGNTVYCLKGYHCDGTWNEDYTLTYNNEGITRYDEPHDYMEKQNLQGLYAMTCSKCNAYADDKRTIKGFAGEGKDLVVTEEDGTYKVEQLTITDAEPYASPVELEVEQMTYERNLAGKAGKWQALYVPFGFDCDDLSDSYELAYINNFHEYLQKDGKTNVVLEVRKLTSGTVQPLTPYLVRLKEGADATQPLFKGSKALTLSPAESRYIDCFSMTRYYKFTGVLQPKMEFSADHDFVMNGGMLYKASSSARLSPQRWYLSATDRNGNGGNAQQAASLKSIAIEVVGEGTATGIEDIYVATDIEGMQSTRQGICDLQGRKLNAEPASGVYIKNGKKCVK